MTVDVGGGYQGEPTRDGSGWVLWTPDGEYIRDEHGRPVVWPSEGALRKAADDHRSRQHPGYRDRQHKGYPNRSR